MAATVRQKSDVIAKGWRVKSTSDHTGLVSGRASGSAVFFRTARLDGNGMTRGCRRNAQRPAGAHRGPRHRFIRSEKYPAARAERCPAANHASCDAVDIWYLRTADPECVTATGLLLLRR